MERGRSQCCREIAYNTKYINTLLLSFFQAEPLYLSSSLLHEVNRPSTIKNILIFINFEIASLHPMKTTIWRLRYCRISNNGPLKSLYRVWHFCYWWPLWQRSLAFLLELPCQGAKSLPIIALLLEYLKPVLKIFFCFLAPL